MYTTDKKRSGKQLCWINVSVHATGSAGDMNGFFFVLVFKTVIIESHILVEYNSNTSQAQMMRLPSFHRKANERGKKPTKIKTGNSKIQPQHNDMDSGFGRGFFF